MADNIVIVLDSGHCGENNGWIWNGLAEEEMNQVTVQAMVAELKKYKGIDVFLTNADTQTMSQEEKAEYGQSVGADVIISLHFNLSPEHKLFGSEVIIPSSGPEYSKMHSLGDIFLEQFESAGLNIRGVKTKLEQDGLIQAAEDMKIPCILVEHGYADSVVDYAFMDNAQELQALGRMDATAVAKFYGLKSEELQTDYSSYVKNAYFVPEQAVDGDQTKPQNAVLVFKGEKEGNRYFAISAKETESRLSYYDYSLDGGKTWSELFPFTDEDAVMTFPVSGIEGGEKLCARIYNGYSEFAETNSISMLEETITETETRKPEGINAIGFCTLFFLAASIILLHRRKKISVFLSVLFIIGLCGMIVLNIPEKEQIQKKIIQVESDQISEWERLKANRTREARTEVIYDIREGYLRVPLVENMWKNPYKLSGFFMRGGYPYYADAEGTMPIYGVDVSKFQGEIDWNRVRKAGMEFAMIRLGLRGYGTGKILLDDKFYVNLEGAQNAGLKTGVYFFSSAINEEEAREEADFVIQQLKGYQIQLPVVFDTEPIYDDIARTDDMTPNMVTEAAIAFCEQIRKAGYTPMIYANSKRYTMGLHIEQLADYEMWLADYREVPDYPYRFRMWQFTESGKVDGIDGQVDINLLFPEYARENLDMENTDWGEEE